MINGYKNILVEKRGKVLILTFNRPEAMNAIDFDTMDDLEHFLDQVEADQESLALVISGSKQIFVSGGDLKYFQQIDDIHKARQMSLRMRRILSTLEGLDIPVIAAVEGNAYGGGCEIAVACDIRICSAQAIFSFKQVDFAVTPGWGAATRLYHLLGRSKTLIVLLTAEEIKADQALEMGLVDQVTEPGHALDAALEMAGKIAKKPPLAVRMIKRAVDKSKDMGSSSSMQLEGELFSITWDSEDHRQATECFFKKNPPKWKGR